MSYNELLKQAFQLMLLFSGIVFLILYNRSLRINNHYWAEEILHLAWANKWPSLNELEKYLPEFPKVNNHLVYIVNTDRDGNILDMDPDTGWSSRLIGYYTDGKNYALTFLWHDGLDESPECICIGKPAIGKSICRIIKLPRSAT